VFFNPTEMLVLRSKTQYLRPRKFSTVEQAMATMKQGVEALIPRLYADITLGVPLSDDGGCEILGCFAFPRLLVRNARILGGTLLGIGVLLSLLLIFGVAHDPRAVAHYADGQLVIADVVLDLLGGAQHEDPGDRGNVGDLPAVRQSCRHADHVRL